MTAATPRWLLYLLAATSMLGACQAQTIPPDLALIDACPSCANFSNPLAVRHAGDGSGRLFIVEQGGRIRILRDGAVLTTDFLSFNTGAGGSTPPGGFTSGGERGLLGLAFHPDYASNGRFFINYTDGSGHTVIARYQVSTGDPNVADASTRLVILRIKQDFSNHNGGNLLFGPDGYLYIGMGDGGSGNDPCNRAQSLTPFDLVANDLNDSSCPAGSFTGNPNSRALLGKMLRIDVDQTTPASSNELCGAAADGSANYAIPADNPFAGSMLVPLACDEILDYGLRNPWRFSFDRANGDLFIGDVGQNAREEVSLRRAGPIGAPLNFGWDCREGFLAAGGICRAGDTLTDPILDYNRTAGTSITGGYRYRGTIPELVGAYVFADYVSRRVWIVTETSPGVFGPQPTSSNHWALAPGLVSSFGEDQQGRLYISSFNGRIYRFRSASEDEPPLFRNGFEPTPAP